jgi:hypothetical protein
MVAPGTRRPGKWRDGVIQIHITRACDKACFACTQGSNLGGKTEFMPPEMFEQAVRSLGFSEEKCYDIKNPAFGLTEGAYFGVVGVFGGNPALSPHFGEYCRILHKLVPFEQRGLWCNNPVTREKAEQMRATFNPHVSNLNVHLDSAAYAMFRTYWPNAHVVGLYDDSRHAPVHLAMKDVVADEEKRWDFISNCDINQHWSAMIGVFRGELRAWFCEVAGAQAMLHQWDTNQTDNVGGTGQACTCGADRTGPSAEAHDDDCPAKVRLTYPDTGLDPTMRWDDLGQWWQLPMLVFQDQVRKHCHECGVPLRGYGELSQADDGAKEQTSKTHASIFKPKRKDRPVEVVTELVQLNVGRIEKVNHYLQNSHR